MDNKNTLVNKLVNSNGMWAFISSLLAILCGFIISFILLLVSNPSNALGGFTAILIGGFSNMRDLGQVFYSATPIILTGLSVCFAYKTGLFNIGASGQFTFGACAAIIIGVHCTFIPGPLLWITCMLAAMVAGALWGVIPGILKATRNVNIVISCIMTNYIGMFIVNELISEFAYNSMRNQSKAVAEHANAPKLGLDLIFVNGNTASSVNAGIFVSIIMGVIVYFIIEKTKFGYELKACGYNADGARYAGINSKRSTVYTMAISGAIAGLGGACLYLAGSGKYMDVVDVIASEGFQGIPVALLGMNNPIGVIFAGIFIAYINQGGFNMQVYGFAPQVIEIITSIIIYFSAFALVMREVAKRYFIRKQKDVPVKQNTAETNSKKQDIASSNAKTSNTQKEGEEK